VFKDTATKPSRKYAKVRRLRATGVVNAGDEKHWDEVENNEDTSPPRHRPTTARTVKKYATPSDREATVKSPRKKSTK
jgi:hypothetical protein